MRIAHGLVALLALFCMQAQAVPITFEFGGTLTQTSNNAFNGANEFPAAVVGESFSGHVTFDSTNFVRTDCAPCSLSTYTFTDPLAMTIAVTFGGFTLQTDTSFDPTLFLSPTLSAPGGHGRISVADNRPMGSMFADPYSFISQTVLPSGNFSGAYVTEDGELVESPVAFLELAFSTGLLADPSFLTGTELPLTPPDISLADNASFSILGGFPNVFVRGTVDFLRLGRTSTVPEPSTLLLLSIGCAMMLVVAARARARPSRTRKM